jgi:hypothetical protein
LSYDVACLKIIYQVEKVIKKEEHASEEEHVENPNANV